MNVRSIGMGMERGMGTVMGMYMGKMMFIHILDVVCK